MVNRNTFRAIDFYYNFSGAVEKNDVKINVSVANNCWSGMANLFKIRHLVVELMYRVLINFICKDS